MADITTYQQPADELTIRMDSATYPRLCRIAPEQAISGFTQIVINANFYRGNQVSNEAAKRIAAALYAELMTNEEGIALGTHNLAMVEYGRIIKKWTLADTDSKTINVAALFRAIITWIKEDGTELQHRANLKAVADNPLAPFHQAFAKALINNNQ